MGNFHGREKLKVNGDWIFLFRFFIPIFSLFIALNLEGYCPLFLSLKDLSMWGREG